MDNKFNLDNLEKKNIYTVPDDFFAQMQRNVFDKIEEAAEEETPVLIPARKSRTRWYYAAAASLAILLSGFWMFRSYEDSSAGQPATVSQPSDLAAIPMTTETPEAPSTHESENYADYTELLEAAPDLEEPAAPKTEKVHFAKQTTSRPYAKTRPVSANVSPAEEIMADLPLEEVRMLVDQSTPDVYLNLYQ